MSTGPAATLARLKVVHGLHWRLAGQVVKGDRFSATLRDNPAVRLEGETPAGLGKAILQYEQNRRRSGAATE